MNAQEYDYEPVLGLPQELPAGEKLLWQGSPRWWPLARRALRVLPVGTYLAAIVLWQGYSAYQAHHAWHWVTRSVGLAASLAVFVIAMLLLIAWAAARATVYSITTRRVVIRHGISLPMSLNIPFQQIQAASLRLETDGSGDLALELPRSQRIGYLLNWPHVRAGHYVQPQPALRGVADAARVAGLLRVALQATQSDASSPKIVRAPRDTATTAEQASAVA